MTKVVRVRMVTILTLAGVLGFVTLAGPTGLAASAFTADAPGPSLTCDTDGTQPDSAVGASVHLGSVAPIVHPASDDPGLTRRPTAAGRKPVSLQSVSSPLRC